MTGLICPNIDCDSQSFKTVDSRPTHEGIRRRRECLTCGTRFRTYEMLMPEEDVIIKTSLTNITRRSAAGNILAHLRTLEENIQYIKQQVVDNIPTCSEAQKEGKTDEQDNKIDTGAAGQQ